MTTLIVDGNNLAHRVRYTFSLDYRGEDTSVTYGFIRVLVADIHKLNISSVIVCWDGGTPAFRKELVPEYKANRTRDWTDLEVESFYGQIKDLRRVLPAMGVVNLFKKGVEADDLMYQASRTIDDACIIYTGDGDLLQAVTADGRVQVYMPVKESMVNWDNFKELVGVEPKHFLDFRTMKGDASDNIKGVPGIGEKLAADVLETYGSLDRAMVQAISWEEPWRANKRAKSKLEAVTQDYIDSIRKVMDLSNGVQDLSTTIKNMVNMWVRYQHKNVKLFCMSKGFHGMFDGTIKMRKTLEGLKAPKLMQLQGYIVNISRLAS